MGAFDGTYITMHLPATERKPYKNLKRFLSQNTLAVCNLDMKFTYGLAKWEEPAHDGRVLNDAIEPKEFQILISKYYLGDVGYPNLDYLLVPYKCV